LQAGARDADGAADRRHHAAGRQAGGGRCGQGTSSLGASGRPSTSATFFLRRQSLLVCGVSRADQS
jgi:hypothetical protein